MQKLEKMHLTLGCNGTSPFKVGDTIEVTCFERGEAPKNQSLEGGGFSRAPSSARSAFITQSTCLSKLLLGFSQSRKSAATRDLISSPKTPKSHLPVTM